MIPWYKEASFYHIYPLGLCGCEHSNNKISVSHSIQEILRWIPHIESMGCNAVYFGPLFQSKTHGYDTTDFRQLDSRLGTNQDFKALVDAFHNKNIRIVVDGVFNHVGRDFFAFKDLQEKGIQSKYNNWFCDIDYKQSSPLGDKFSYQSWSGHYELVKLNLKNCEVKQYLLNAVQFWIDEFAIDGIRLDCADALDMDFMKELRHFCGHAKKDFWLMGEVIHGDYSRWANNVTLHSVTNYEAYKGLFSSHNDVNLFEIAYTLNREFNTETGLYKNIPMYNFTDNHDVDRIAESVKSEAYLYTIYLLLYTMPGVPSLYYGSEWGIKGKKQNTSDWNLRPQIPSESASYNYDIEAAIQKFAAIRSSSLALKGGTYKQLFIDHEQFAFERIGGGEKIIVCINTADNPKTLSLHAAGARYTDLLNKNETGTILQNRIETTVWPHWGKIIKVQ